MEDALSLAIAEKRAQRADLVRQLERLDVEISALELAANLRPALEPSVFTRRQSNGVAVESRGRGRQIGAISETWRNILRMLHEMHPQGASDAEVGEICRAEGLAKIRPRDVSHRMSAMAAHGYVRKDGDLWHVTDVAARRFGFPESQTKTAGDCESPAV